MHQQTPKFSERLVSFVSYITVGWGGMIYCVLMYLRKKNISQFVRFNVFQSIFISFLFFVLCIVLGFVIDVLLHVPFVNYLVSQIMLFFNQPLLFDYSLVQLFIIGLFIYMAVFSLLGKYPRVYKLSKIVENASR